MSNILLYVDDSATMQTVAEITFRNTDWEYVGARTIEEGKSTAGSKSPSLILVDAVMPDGSGYDLAKDLKSSNPDATVVMVCGNSESYDASKGSAAGCTGGIVKPWQTDKIIDQLKELSDISPVATAESKEAEPAKASPVAKTVKKAISSPPRSATLMGMPALEIPAAKPLPAGVAVITPSKPAVPTPTPTPNVIPKATPAPPVRTPAPPIPAIVAKPVAKKPAATTPAPVATPASREPMIKATPGKPIRLVLASQAEAAAVSASQEGGLSGPQATALSDVNREMLEKIIWEVVPDLAEAIIRENLETLTSK